MELLNENWLIEKNILEENVNDTKFHQKLLIYIHSQNMNLKCRIVGNLLKMMKSSSKAIVGFKKVGYLLIITLF